MIVDNSAKKTIIFSVQDGMIGNFDIVFKQFDGNSFSISVSDEENFQYYWNNPGMSPVDFLKKIDFEYTMEKFVGSKLYVIDTEKTVAYILKELKKDEKEAIYNDNEEESLDMIKTLINFFETSKGIDEEKLINIFNGYIDFVTENGEFFRYHDYDQDPSLSYSVAERYKQFFDIIFPQIIKGIEERI